MDHQTLDDAAQAGHVARESIKQRSVFAGLGTSALRRIVQKLVRLGHRRAQTSSASRRVLPKKRDNRISDRVGLLEQDHMTGLGDVHDFNSGPESFTKAMAVLRRSEAVFQTLDDKKWQLPGRFHPVVLRCRTVSGPLGGGGRPALHLTKDLMCRCRITDRTKARARSAKYDASIPPPGINTTGSPAPSARNSILASPTSIALFACRQPSAVLPAPIWKRFT